MFQNLPSLLLQKFVKFPLIQQLSKLSDLKGESGDFAVTSSVV